MSVVARIKEKERQISMWPKSIFRQFAIGWQEWAESVARYRPDGHFVYPGAIWDPSFAPASESGERAERAGQEAAARRSAQPSPVAQDADGGPGAGRPPHG
jgi:hypothetical protein